MTESGGPRKLESRCSTRWALLVAAIAFLSCFACACERRGGAREAGNSAGEVTLYASADDTITGPLIEAFERQSGLTVLLRGDTEATKTTGLVQRLRTERAHPRADLFWSSEVFLTIALAGEGILASTPAPPDWPGGLRGDDDRWVAFALRGRVCVFNTSRVEASAAPRTMHELLEPRFARRIVIARPAFGTTRGHLAALVAIWGEDRARDWLRRMSDAGVRFVDGNSAVVRAVAQGEADVGLSDTDDAWAARRLGWPVDFIHIRHDIPGAEPPIRAGPLLIPNTISLVAGGPNPAGARRLAEFLLSEEAERRLAGSESRNFPVRPALAGECAAIARRPDDPATVSYEAVARAMPRAMELIRAEWGQ